MQGQEYIQGGDRVMRIKSIDPVSAGKVYGLLGAIFGLLIGGLIALISLALAGAASSGASGSSNAAGGIFAIFAAAGAFAIVIYPVIYAVMGFIMGLLGALFYNLVAKVAGGIELTVE